MIPNEVKERFYTIWESYIRSYVDNDRYKNLANNIKLIKTYKGLVTKYTNEGSMVLELPKDRYQYYVYKCNLSDTSGLIYTNTIKPFYKGKWIRGDILQNNYGVVLEIYDRYGRILPLTSYYVKTSLVNNVLYISVNYSYLNLLNINSDYLYVYIYKKHVSDDYKVLSYSNLRLLASVNNLDEIQNYLSNLTDEEKIKHRCIINAKFSTVNDTLDFLDNLNIEDYKLLSIDVIKNNDIRFINQYKVSETYKYLALDGSYKNLIHISRKYNDDLRKYTYDTIDIYIYSPSQKYGIRIPYHDKQSVFQLTDCNISIKEDLIQVIINEHFKSQDDLEWYIYVRDYNNKSMGLNRQLYQIVYENFSDNEMMRYLTQYQPGQMEFFKALRFEKSRYIKALTDGIRIDEMSYYQGQDLEDHALMSLGYYKSTNLVYWDNYEFEINSDDILNGVKSFDLCPLFQGVKIYPLIFRNGYLDSNISYGLDENTLSITTLGLAEGDRIYIRLLPTYTDYFEHIIPNENNNTVIINKSDLKVDSSNIIYTKPKVFKESQHDFRPYFLDISKDDSLVSITEDGDHFYIHFTSLSYSQKYKIILSDFSTIKFTKYFDIDHDIIKIPVSSDEDEYYPEISSMLVFLNDKILIENIDYKVITDSKNDEHSGYEIYIQNVDKLNLNSSNKIEFLIFTNRYHESVSIRSNSIDNGYGCINKMIVRDLFRQFNIIYDGKVIHKSTTQIFPRFIKSLEDIEDHKPCQIEFSVPMAYVNEYYDYEQRLQPFEGYVSDEHEDIDVVCRHIPTQYERLNIIDELLEIETSTETEDILGKIENCYESYLKDFSVYESGIKYNDTNVYQKYPLYSIYTTFVINKFLEGDFDFHIYRTTEEIWDIISQYNYMKQYDLFYTEHEFNIQSIYPMLHYNTDYLQSNMSEKLDKLCKALWKDLMKRY